MQVKSDVQPDRVVYNCLVDMYCNKRDMVNAWAVYEYLRDHTQFDPDVITYTTLCDGYSLLGDADGAIKVGIILFISSSFPALVTKPPHLSPSFRRRSLRCLAGA